MEMVYTIRFVSDEEPDFELDVKVSPKHTFADLHNAIQKKLNFDDKFLASFFVSNAKWEKLEEITLMDMGEGCRLMSDTLFGKFFGKTGQKMLYVFDYFSERLLFGNIISESDEDSLSAPCALRLDGHIPPQVAPESDFLEGDDSLFSGEEMTSDDFDFDELSDEMSDGYSIE